MKTFFKLVISNIGVLYKPPSPSYFDGFPIPPGKVVPLTFFVKITIEDVKEIT